MFIIYGQPNCAFCEAAKRELKGNYIYIDITLPSHFREFREEYPTARTVPQIREIADSGDVLWTGNYNELMTYLKSLDKKDKKNAESI